MISSESDLERCSTDQFLSSNAKETTMADTRGSGTSGASSSGSVFSHETDELIASNKVEGTAVYNRQGERVGTVHHFMVGKRSGQVAYAVMSFGGFMGLGEKQFPLPAATPPASHELLRPVCTENPIRVYRMVESAKLAR